MVTVIIPTCNRPHFLREAIESVRQQTALDRIGQVIVSENGGCRDSQAVCEEFPGLPICYLYQEPPVPVSLHLREIWPHVKSPLVAFLHDDDWWAPEHLERSTQALDDGPHFAGVFSNHFNTYGPEHPAQIAHGWARQVWLASGCDFRNPIVNLDQESVILAGLWGAAFHYSTMVARKEFVWDAYGQVVRTENEYDNDRTFPIFLAEHGPVAYLTRPDIFVRWHAAQDNKRFSERLNEIFIQTTRWIQRTWPDKVAAAAQRFNATADRVDPSHVESIKRYGSGPFRSVLVEECGLRIPDSLDPIRLPPKGLRWFIKQTCPPILLIVKRGLYKRFSASKR